MEAMGGFSGVPHSQQGSDQEARNGALPLITASRAYRRGNWTLPETMQLIEAKRKVHEERHPGDQGLARWRWVEDYCWRAGCRRSQNQCNDRWDNLMRDYKKVRAYEMAGRAPSYWAMGRAERKEKGLPSNLLREVYDAMTEVVERKKMSTGCSGGAGGMYLGPSSSFLDIPLQASPLAQVLPPAMPQPLGPLEQVTRGQGVPQFSSESPERKRRRSSLDEQLPESGTPDPGTRFHHQEHEHPRDRLEDDRCDGSSDGDSDDEEAVLSGAIGRCAAILSEALENREAAEERRHREVMAVEERRGRALQARRKAGEQSVAELAAAAVNQLAGSMLALAGMEHKGGHGPAAPK